MWMFELKTKRYFGRIQIIISKFENESFERILKFKVNVMDACQDVKRKKESAV